MQTYKIILKNSTGGTIEKHVKGGQISNGTLHERSMGYSLDKVFRARLKADGTLNYIEIKR